MAKLLSPISASITILSRGGDAVMPLSGQRHESGKVAKSADQGDDRWPDFESPFCARAILMDADDGSVDHGVF